MRILRGSTQIHPLYFTQIHPLYLRLAEWEELIGITILPGLFDLGEVRLDNFCEGFRTDVFGGYRQIQRLMPSFACISKIQGFPFDFAQGRLLTPPSARFACSGSLRMTMYGVLCGCFLSY
jgi:hypothetical protein